MGSIATSIKQRSHSINPNDYRLQRLSAPHSTLVDSPPVHPNPPTEPKKKKDRKCCPASLCDLINRQCKPMTSAAPCYTIKNPCTNIDVQHVQNQCIGIDVSMTNWNEIARPAEQNRTEQNRTEKQRTVEWGRSNTNKKGKEIRSNNKERNYKRQLSQTQTNRGKWNITDTQLPALETKRTTDSEGGHRMEEWKSKEDGLTRHKRSTEAPEAWSPTLSLEQLILIVIVAIAIAGSWCRPCGLGAMNLKSWIFEGGGVDWIQLIVE